MGSQAGAWEPDQKNWADELLFLSRSQAPRVVDLIALPQRGERGDFRRLTSPRSPLNQQTASGRGSCRSFHVTSQGISHPQVAGLTQTKCGQT